MRGNLEKNNNPVNIRFVAKASDIRKLSESITSDVLLKYQEWQHWCQLPTLHCTVIGLTRERFVALGLPS